MVVVFQSTKQDYIKFFQNIYFRKDFGKRLILLVLGSFSIGCLALMNNPLDPLNFAGTILFVGLFFFSLGALIPYLKSTALVRGMARGKDTTVPMTLDTREEGIGIKSEKSELFWNWKEIKNIKMEEKYMFVSSFKNQFFLIPMHSFASDNEAVELFKLINDNISRLRNPRRERKPNRLYYFGLLGFVPNIGAITGIVLTVLGLNKGDKLLVLIGMACIIFTVIFWRFIFPFLTHVIDLPIKINT